MIVCPQCRNANDEDASTCSRCGAALVPGPTYLLSRRPAAARPPIEIAAPKPPSPWRGVVALVVVVAAAVGMGAWYLLRPDPCEGTNFDSENFGYCLTIPDGWTAESAMFGGDVTLDQFSAPSEPATVVVEAVDLTQDADLAAFAQAVRDASEESGLTPGRVRQATIDGTPAQLWDIEYSTDDGDSYLGREVVVVRDEVGWRLSLNDLASGFDEHVASFEAMLSSFRFR